MFRLVSLRTVVILHRMEGNLTIASLCLFIPGMDATTVFQDIGHSFEALKVLSKYQIGELSEVSV